MPLLYHAYVYLEFLILACTIYILAPDFVTKPLNEMRLMECTECEMSAPGAYDIDIEADDINVTDTATVIWEIA